MISDETVASARILVVDDEPEMVSLLTRLLKRAGYERVLSTGDSGEVEDLVRVFRPDLIILDSRLAALDGRGVLEKLRLLQQSEVYLPVIITSADLEPALKLRSLLAGAKDFIEKPFNTMEFMLRVRIQLETRFLVQALVQSHVRPLPSPSPIH